MVIYLLASQCTSLSQSLICPSKNCYKPFSQEHAEEETHSVVNEIINQAKSTNSEAEEDAVASEEAEEVPEDDYVDYSSDNKYMTLRNDIEEDNEVSEILHSEDNEVSFMW